MKIIFLFLLCGLIAFCGGCAAVGTSLNMIDKEKADTIPFKLNVISTPSGAGIYINDKLLGYTPSEIHLQINYKCRLVTWVCTWYLCNPSEQYVLRVSKEGYRDAIEPIQFDRKYSYSHFFYEPGKNADRAMGEYMFPSKDTYKFNLESDPAKINVVQKELSGNSSVSNADEIIKYKKLLDEGVITKEEFEKKKKQLLGI